MKISKSFSFEKWDVSTDELIVSFWESRKIVLEKKSENFYEGKRGSILGNLISYDMRKLMTELNVLCNDNEIRCELEIKTFGQIITKWNKEYWDLELETFESVLLENNNREIEWKEYYKSTYKKNILWTMRWFALGVFVYVMVQIFL